MKTVIFGLCTLLLALVVFAFQVSSVIGPPGKAVSRLNSDIRGYALEQVKNNASALGVRDLRLAATPLEITATFVLFSQFGDNQYPDFRVVTADHLGRERERIVSRDHYQHRSGNVTSETISFSLPRRGEEMRITIFPFYSK